jgi:hypothetical protein
VRGYVIQHFMFLLFLGRGIGREARAIDGGCRQVDGGGGRKS